MLQQAEVELALAATIGVMCWKLEMTERDR